MQEPAYNDDADADHQRDNIYLFKILSIMKLTRLAYVSFFLENFDAQWSSEHRFRESQAREDKWSRQGDTARDKPRLLCCLHMPFLEAVGLTFLGLPTEKFCIRTWATLNVFLLLENKWALT